MIARDLATQLAAAGLTWDPAAGDRFGITTEGMESDVFHLADMVADLHDFVDGSVVGFNGTTEWALDMVELDHVLFLPREDQLRDRLGEHFAGLRRGSAAADTAPAGDPGPAYVVELADGTVHRAPDPEDAYGLALLHVLTMEMSAGDGRLAP